MQGRHCPPDRNRKKLYCVQTHRRTLGFGHFLAVPQCVYLQDADREPEAAGPGLSAGKCLLLCLCKAHVLHENAVGRDPFLYYIGQIPPYRCRVLGRSTVGLLKLCKNAKLLDLTATNVRYLDNNRDMAELFDGHIASEMTLGEAIVRGILSAPKYVTTVYQYQKTSQNTRLGWTTCTLRIQDVNQKYLDILRRALEQEDGLDKVFAHHITDKSGKYIVFCANKEHMFRRKGVPWQMVRRQQYAPGNQKDSRFVTGTHCLLNAIGMQWRNLTRGSTGMNWRRNIKDAMEIWTFQQNTRQRMASG